MFKRSMLVLAFCLLLLPVNSFAQLDSGQFGVYFDPYGTERTLYPPMMVPFQWYVLAFDLEGDVSGFEFKLDIDPSILVLDRSFREIILPIVGWEDDNWIVSTLACEEGAGWYTMVVYTGMILNFSNDLSLCLGPSEPSSMDPSQPDWLDCEGIYHAFEYAPTPCPLTMSDNCSVVNPSVECPPVATGIRSWGTFKALY